MAKKVHQPVIDCPLLFFHGGDAKLISSHFVRFKGFTIVLTCVEHVLNLNVALSSINYSNDYISLELISFSSCIFFFLSLLLKYPQNSLKVILQN